MEERERQFVLIDTLSAVPEAGDHVTYCGDHMTYCALRQGIM